MAKFSYYKGKEDELMSHFFQRIDTELHEKMKTLAKTKGTKSVTDEYRLAIENWLAQENQKIVLEDSKILTILQEQLMSMEDRLVKINGRMGMDVATVLVGMMHMLAQKYNVSEGDIYDDLRPLAAKHFSKSRKESKPEM